MHVFDLWSYSGPDLTVNIDETTFQGGFKMGDLISVLNVVCDIRRKNSNCIIKFHLAESSIQKRDYVRLFLEFVMSRTDYFDESPGEISLVPYGNLWDYRKREGEWIKISNPENTERKLCLFPLVDAEYDPQRNWPQSVLQGIIDEYSTSEYSDYSRILCIKKLPDNIDPKEFTISTDFTENLEHILTCEYYIGGATGLSLLASVLDNPTRKLVYYYNDGMHGSWPSVFTAPFYINSDNSEMRFYNFDKELMLPNYNKNSDGLIYQIEKNIITYDEEYVNTRYNTYGILNDLMSNLRLGYVIGSIGKIPDSIMDIGYGNGSFLSTCSSIVNSCYGYDVTGYPIPENAIFIEDWVSHKVEVLTLFDVLEHMEDPYILKNCQAEYIVVSLPWCHYHSSEWFDKWKHRRPNEHLWFFDEASIFKFANSIGYEVINFCNLEDSIRVPIDSDTNILTFTLKRKLHD
jgi:hypothetical protein